MAIKFDPFEKKKLTIGVPVKHDPFGKTPITQGRPAGPNLKPGAGDPFMIKPKPKPVIGQPVATAPAATTPAIKNGVEQKFTPPTVDQTYQDAQTAINEAKTKTEASKTSALAGFEGVDTQLAGMGDLISPEQKQQLMNSRKDTLAQAGQNLTEAFGDSNSGIQTGRRIGIASDIANRGASLGIDTEMDIASMNREANMKVIGQRTDIAGNKANIQMGYSYDPGLDYISNLSEALGNGIDSDGGVGAYGSNQPLSEATDNGEKTRIQSEISNLEAELSKLRGSGSIYDLSGVNRKTEINNRLNQLKRKLRFL